MMLKLLFSLFLILNLFSCLKEPDNTLETQEAELTLSGRLTDLSGTALSKVAIFANDRDKPFTYSDDLGNFSMTLTPSYFSQEVASQSGLRLYYIADNLVGVSSEISLNYGSTIDLGDELLKQGQTIEGTVSLLDGNQNIVPVSDVEVKVGRFSAKTSTTGEFVMENLPVGNLPVLVQLPGFLAYEDALSTDPLVRSETASDILLYEDDLSGVVVAGNTLIDDLMEFFISAAPGVGHVRFGTLTQNFDPETRSLTGPWVPVTEIFSFNTAEDPVLFYQFANADQDRFSPVYELNLVSLGDQ